MNWSRLLPLRRRHLRRPARGRGAAGVLPRVDVPRAVDLRLGQAAARAARRLHLDRRTSARCSSAYFILAANSWMQHPVGYTYNPDTGRAELTDFWAVMFNKVQLVTFPHTILAAYMTGAGPSCWASAPGSTCRRSTRTTARSYRRSIRLGAWVVLVAGLGVAITGDFQGKIMTEVQPMKMAAAEALYDTEDRARRSPSSRSVRRTAPARSSRSRSRTCCPSSPPAASTARSRASTTCARSTRRSTARTPARATTTRAATTRRSSR